MFVLFLFYFFLHGKNITNNNIGQIDCFDDDIDKTDCEFDLP